MAEQEYIVFDFDGTLYKKDCTVDFHLYILRQKPSAALYLPFQLCWYAMWKSGWVSTSRFKEKYLVFLNHIGPDELARHIHEFWEQKTPRDFYDEMCRCVHAKIREGYSCVVITASPQLLVAHAVRQLFGISCIGTLITYTGKGYKLSSPNCKGTEKVKRFEEAFGSKAVIAATYSDNRSDQPLFNRSVHAYKVSGSAIGKIK